MRKIFIAIMLIIFTWAGTAAGAEITFAWDANTEADLAGYKIYAGKISRFDPVLDPAAILVANQEKCQSVYTDPAKLQICKDQWAAFCPDTDKLCDFDFYAYESVVDVKNVTEYKMIDIGDGKWFFAASAYDTSGNESKFSEELSLIINTSRPRSPTQFKATIKASKITIETD